MVFIVVFIFAFILIEMTSSIITNFCFFARQINLLPNVDDGVKRLNFTGTTFKILLREIGFEISVKVVKRRMFLANFSPGATSSIMVVHSIVLPTMLTMQFGYCFLKYW
jgi:hypothetical protein